MFHRQLRAALVLDRDGGNRHPVWGRLMQQYDGKAGAAQAVQFLGRQAAREDQQAIGVVLAQPGDRGALAGRGGLDQQGIAGLGRGGLDAPQQGQEERPADLGHQQSQGVGLARSQHPRRGPGHVGQIPDRRLHPFRRLWDHGRAAVHHPADRGDRDARLSSYIADRCGGGWGSRHGRSAQRSARRAPGAWRCWNSCHSSSLWKIHR